MSLQCWRIGLWWSCFPPWFQSRGLLVIRSVVVSFSWSYYNKTLRLRQVKNGKTFRKSQIAAGALPKWQSYQSWKSSCGSGSPNTESWQLWHIPEILYSFLERLSRNSPILFSQVTQFPAITRSAFSGKIEKAGLARSGGSGMIILYKGGEVLSSKKRGF